MDCKVNWASRFREFVFLGSSQCFTDHPIWCKIAAVWNRCRCLVARFQLVVPPKMDSKLHTTSIVLAVLGLLDSIYLVWVKYTGAYALCGPIGNCESVNSSRYSEIYGIPIALLGAFAYLMMLVFLLLENRGRFWNEYNPIIVFGMSLIGVLYSLYLTYIEIFVLKAICPYCVISAIILVLLLILSGIRFAISMRDPDSL